GNKWRRRDVLPGAPGSGYDDGGERANRSMDRSLEFATDILHVRILKCEFRILNNRKTARRAWRGHGSRIRPAARRGAAAARRTGTSRARCRTRRRIRRSRKAAESSASWKTA